MMDPCTEMNSAPVLVETRGRFIYLEFSQNVFLLVFKEDKGI